ncbi:MAG: hypothetical protein MJZ10_11880 [Fibrobacter sp.]|nr:hypothetical protein [Fibrobacter sp.]
MAGENLESTLIIKDEASAVLEKIAKQSEETGEALADVLQALKSIDAVGEVQAGATIKAETAPKAPKDQTRTAAEERQGGNIWESAQEANEVASILEETNAILAEIPETAQSALSEWDDFVKEIEGVFKEIPKEAESAAEEISTVVKEITETAGNVAEEIQEEIEQTQNEFEDIIDDIEDTAEDTGKKVEKGVRGLGADIGGWWSIIKDVLNKIGDIFGKLAKESDKLNMRIARFGLVADSEGKTGDARGARSEELYKQHQKFSQALGVQSEAFNETVLNMYSNGAGVVKSIEDAQRIAASSYMAMDIAGLSGRDKDAVMGEVQSMVAVGIADADQIQESMKIAPNILRTIEKQWEQNMNGKGLRLNDGTEIKDATGKIAILAQEGQITAELVAQAMINSAEETNEKWKTLPSTWEKLKNRVEVIVENMTAGIMKKFGELADDARIANFIASALEFGQDVVDFMQTVVIPVVGGALMAIMSALTTIFDVLKNWYTAVPVLLAVGAVLVQIAVNTGILTKAFTALKVVLTAISANPVMAILGAVLLATLAVAHLVRTTQRGQEIMLEVTAAISFAFQQVATAITNLPDIIMSALRGVKSYMSWFVTGILEIVAKGLEMLGKFSDTAKEAAESVRTTIAERNKEQEAFDKESEELKKGWMGEFEANSKHYDEYRLKIPEMAAENLLRNKEDLKLDGFLDSVLKNQENAPGTKNNPATVKGKVAIDGEYYDIIKRSAGAEIVNRYTTMRPTVNAKFGDINQMNAKDVLKDLVEEMERAKGASLAEAQAQGA